MGEGNTKIRRIRGEVIDTLVRGQYIPSQASMVGGLFLEAHVDGRDFAEERNGQRPTANGQRPTANGQRPTANGQRPTVTFRAWLFRIGRLIIAVVLVAAAAAKIHGLGRIPLTESWFFASPQLQIGVIEAELLVACLLWGRYARAGWFAAICMFVLFGTASAYTVLSGGAQQSCGCLGAVPLKSYHAMLLDAAILGILLTCHPPRPVAALAQLPFRAMGTTALGAIGIFAILCGAFWVFVGKSPEALARWRGESIAVDPTVTSLGDGIAGEQRTFQLTLTNYTDQPVRVLGGTTTRRCVATDDLPITLLPRESQSINVRVLFMGAPGRFQDRFILYTDNESQRTITPAFGGRVVASPDN